MTKTNQIKYICLHHTAVSRETQPAQFYPVNRYHKQKWGMKSKLGYYTGYTYFIGTNGCLTQTREIGEETMAIKGHNFDSIHICLAGDFLLEDPTEKQKGSLIECISDLRQDYPSVEVKLHSEMQKNRTCPGFDRFYLDNFILYNIEDGVKTLKIQELQRLLDKLKELLHNLMQRIR